MGDPYSEKTFLGPMIDESESIRFLYLPFLFAFFSIYIDTITFTRNFWPF